MKNTQMLKLILVLTSTTTFIFFSLFLYFYCKRTSKRQLEEEEEDIETADHTKHGDSFVGVRGEEELVTFHGGEDLSISDILDAPGEVIGKSNYGTLYKAFLQNSNSVRLLRFMRPVCTTRSEDFQEVVRFLGTVRHPNLVPLLGFYAGPRGEKLLVHPFQRRGNLAYFIRGNIQHTYTIYIYIYIYRCINNFCSGSFLEVLKKLSFFFGFESSCLGLKKGLWNLEQRMKMAKEK